VITKFGTVTHDISPTTGRPQVLCEGFHFDGEIPDQLTEEQLLLILNIHINSMSRIKGLLEEGWSLDEIRAARKAGEIDLSPEKVWERVL